MSSNESLEVYVISMFREVRQDIRELRAEIRTLHDKIDATRASLSAKIEENYSRLDKRIDARSR